MPTNKKKKIIETVVTSAAEAEASESSEKATTPISKDQQTALVSQTQKEWKRGWDNLKPKWTEWGLRLKLYNNQRRDKDSVGDTTLFDIFQTVLADLYADTLVAEFGPREMGDENIAENLTLTAEYDHSLMEKDIADYEWDWEAMFYGRGLMCLMDFDTEQLCPVPEVWYALTVVRDPEAKSVNGDKRGRGRARFLYRETRMTRDEMKDAGVYFNLDGIKPDSTSTQSPLDELMRVQAEAAGIGNALKYETDTVRIREGFTTFNGKLVFVSLANEGTTVVRYKEIGRFSKTRMPIVDRVLFPIPNSWDSVSIPDLVEDKQRGKAVALNLSLKTVKAGLYPMYVYDQTKFDDRTDFNFEFNKFIPARGDPSTAVSIMPRDRVKQDVSFIMDTLDQSAQRATATPDIKRGGRPDAAGTATRDALVAKGSDKRYSLATAVFGWSERRFWQLWYQLYKEHMDDKINEKIIRISGALGASWRKIEKKDIVSASVVDPDVVIESKEVATAKRVAEAQIFRDYLTQAAASPDTNMRFGLRHYGKLIGVKADVIKALFPPTIEEMRADDENDQLEKGEIVEVTPQDDHIAHLLEHNTLADSPTKTAHINAHKRAMLIQHLAGEKTQSNPMAMPGSQLPGVAAMTPGTVASARRAIPATPLP